MLRSLYRYRSFIWQHALNDMRHRYAGTAMGVVWNVIHPLSLMAVYALVFSLFIARFIPGPDGRNVPYVVFLCSGFFPWMAFAECLTRGSTAFASNAAYLKKLPIPEQVFVAQGAASATLGLVISFSLLLAVSMPLGIRLTWYWLLLPIPLILLQAVGFGFGLILGTLNVFFTDVGQLIGIAMGLLFWLAPIIYPLNDPRIVKRPWLLFTLECQPVTPAIEALRDLFLWRQLPPLWTFAALAAWAAGTILVGCLMLHALRAEIRDVI